MSIFKNGHFSGHFFLNFFFRFFFKVEKMKKLENFKKKKFNQKKKRTVKIWVKKFCFFFSKKTCSFMCVFKKKSEFFHLVPNAIEKS